jgi:hypothetical protein
MPPFQNCPKLNPLNYIFMINNGWHIVDSTYGQEFQSNGEFPYSKYYISIYNNWLFTSNRIHLYPDWNLISVPVELFDNNIGHFFTDDVKNHIESVWAWDDFRQDWVYYSQDQNNYFYKYYPHFTTIQPTRGFWVEYNGTEDVSFPVYGEKPSQDIVTYDSLYSGWTLVGYPSTVLRTPDSLYSSAVCVWGWDGNSQDWT